MAPQTQKALVVPTERAPWELRTDWPVPSVGPRDVLVKLVAAALNPADWRIQANGIWFVKDYPYLGGVDGAGIIEEVGAEVTNFVKGDKMYVLCRSFSILMLKTVHMPWNSISLTQGGFPKNMTFTEYCAVPAETIAKVRASF